MLTRLMDMFVTVSLDTKGFIAKLVSSYHRFGFCKQIMPCVCFNHCLGVVFCSSPASTSGVKRLLFCCVVVFSVLTQGALT